MFSAPYFCSPWFPKVLVGIPLETGQKQYSVDYKLETYLKIARLYLEDEDPVQGEAYINRAAILLTQTKNDGLQIIYKVCQGRVLDYKRKFIEAASRYPLSRSFAILCNYNGLITFNMCPFEVQ